MRQLTGVPEERLERLAGGDLSEVLLLRRPEGRLSVAKGGASVGTEAAMLRAIASTGTPAPMVEGEHDGILLLEHVANDGVFSPHAWGDIGIAIRRLHDHRGTRYGWPVDYRIGTIELDNREGGDWPSFWGQQRLAATASILDRPWRDRIERLLPRLALLLPPSPDPVHLHGDLWSGNILVAEGRLVALIDPACCFGHCEVDLAMLDLFDTPPGEFWEAYGGLDDGWRQRRPIYQLFPALVHLRLFGAAYAGMVDRLLEAVET
ncbi:fructosamine kinase family protein [Sphingosinicella sp. GR2756]|uniref:Fructosamine kinase family protein n=1 Tax=Sphingosinicella rhizophila TaxID=3050082 RepID=A0ABU3Q4G6_9SPHN|nr:fructosamine kinase family protein [Sphingosinicella sp. GR2756]